VKLSQTSRVSFFTVLLLTFFTVGIGGITVKHSLDVEIEKVDQSLGFVALSAYENPGQAVGAALFAIEQSNLDATLTLLARDGSETLINESTLEYPGAPALSEVEKAVRSPIRVPAATPFRLRAVPLEGGDFIIIALSTSEIDAHFISDLKYLALVTLILNSFAAGLLFLYFRRERRTADSASLARMQEFLGDASHELRTPLTAIRGFAELHRQGAVKGEEKTGELIRRIEQESIRMSTLVEDLLLLARLDQSREMEFEPVDLKTLVSEAVTSAKAAGPKHNFNFRIPESEVFVLGDSMRIHQVITNLLANARTHTPEGTAVQIEINSLPEGVEVVVSDNGPGLSKADQERIFERFYRADPSRTRNGSEGTGLGLSIVDAVMRAHGGHVKVESEVGSGAKFKLFFPLKS